MLRFLRVVVLLCVSAPLHSPQSQSKSADILATLTSPDVINSLAAVLLARRETPRTLCRILSVALHPLIHPPTRQAMLIAAWLSWAIEGRSNGAMQTIERNVYWAVVTLTTVRLARCLACPWREPPVLRP